MSGVEVSKISIEMYQEGNTLGTTEEYEKLTVDIEYQLPGEEGFLVIRTDGWSMDDPEELVSLLTKIKEAEHFLRDKVETKE